MSSSAKRNFFWAVVVVLIVGFFYPSSDDAPTPSEDLVANEEDFTSVPVSPPQAQVTPKPLENEFAEPTTAVPPELPLKSEEVKEWGKAIYSAELMIEDHRVARQRVYKTGLKYPLMMVQQLWEVSEIDGSVGNYLGERKMVADHLVVRLREPDAQQAAFESKIASQKMSVRKKMYASGLYLVTFPVESATDFQEAQAYLMSLPEVSSATPDIFGKSF